MGPFVVIEPEVPAQILAGHWDGVVVLQVDLLVLHGAPEALGKYVVHGPSPSIHADADLRRLQPAGEIRARELDTLIAVDDLGRCSSQGSVERLQAEGCIQRDRHRPRYHVPTEPVHNRHQIHEPLRESDVRDIRPPDLIGSRDGQPSEQVGVPPMLRRSHAQPRLWVDGFQPHPPHEPPHSFPIDGCSDGVEPDRHPAHPIERRPGVLLIDQSHQPPVLGVLRHRLVVPRRPGQPQQLALSSDAELCMVRLDESSQHLNPTTPPFF